jgi:methionyl-tRNA formyltransferase
MRLILFTQDEPFFLAEHLDYLFGIIPGHSEVVGCVVTDPSPFGKKENMLQKVRRTWNVFGFGFLLHYVFQFLQMKLSGKPRIDEVLQKHGVPKIELTGSINSEINLQTLRDYSPDLIISILGNQIFKQNLINLPTKGSINLHTALLPKYRGLMPSFWVLLNEEKYTGVSVFFMDEGIDTGPILVQKKTEIKNRTQKDLIRHTKRLGMEAIAEAVEMIQKDNYKVLPNDDENHTYFSFPTREDVRLFKKKGKRFY